MNCLSRWNSSRAANVRVTVVICVVVALVAALLIFWMLSEDRPEEFLEEWDSPADGLTQLELSPDGELLVAAAASGHVVTWDMYTTKPTLLDQFTLLPISAIGVSSDGFVAATDIQDNFAGWQIGEMRPMILPKLPSHAADIAFGRTRSGTLSVAVALANGSLAFVDPEGVKTVKSPHQGGIKRLLFTAEGRVLITAGADGKLVWWDARKREPGESIEAHSSEIGAIKLSEDGRWLASGDWDGHLRIWNAETRKQEGQMQQASGVSGIAWSGEQFVTGGWDGVIRFWKIHQDEPFSEIVTGHEIHDVAYSNDRGKLATVSGRDSIEWWSVPSE